MRVMRRISAYSILLYSVQLARYHVLALVPIIIDCFRVLCFSNAKPFSFRGCRETALF